MIKKDIRELSEPEMQSLKLLVWHTQSSIKPIIKSTLMVNMSMLAVNIILAVNITILSVKKNEW